MSKISKHTGFVYGPKADEAASIFMVPDSAQVLKDNFDFSVKDEKISKVIRSASTAYLVDGLIRQTVDRYAELFKKFELVGADAPLKYLKSRLNKMSLQSGEHWETFLTRVITEYFKTGNAMFLKFRSSASDAIRPVYKERPHGLFYPVLVSIDRLEPVFNEDKNFVGWKFIDLTGDPKLTLDSSNPLLPSRALISIAGMAPGYQQKAYCPGADIVHVAYKKPADSIYGYGMTLSGLEDIKLLRTIEQIVSVMIKKFSAPLIHHTVPARGVNNIQQDLNNARALYSNRGPDGVIITGDGVKITSIGAESQAIRNEGYLNFFMDRGLAGIAASPFLMGIKGGGLGTVESAIELMMLKARFCQQEISREIERFLFDEILYEGGFNPYTKDSDQVKLTFVGFDEAREIKLQSHAADLFTKNLVDLNEARTIGRITTEVQESKLFGKMFEPPLDNTKKKAKETNYRYISSIYPDDISSMGDFIEELNYLGIDTSSIEKSLYDLFPDSEATILLIKGQTDELQPIT